jgi:hypothetical protein
MLSSLYDARVGGILDAFHTESDKTDPPLLAAAEGKDHAERHYSIGHLSQCRRMRGNSCARSSAAPRLARHRIRDILRDLHDLA